MSFVAGKNIKMSKKGKETHPCIVCSKVFASLWSLKRHKNRHHISVHCPDCDKLLPSKGIYLFQIN